MVSWLEHHSSGVFWGIMRCEKLGPHNYSLHADGRAIDWHLDGRTAAGQREARRHRLKNVDDTTAHRNHIHIGLSRLGARKVTSFWRTVDG